MMAMQARTYLGALILVLATLPVLAEQMGDGRRDRRDRDSPSIVIEPNLDLSRREKPDTNAPDVIMAEVAQCSAAGVLLFIDCLRGNFRPVMIRRLEACVASETIPEDLSRVAACLPRPRLR
jgi:hypothetical protein